jgi:hypothetical protein
MIGFGIGWAWRICTPQGRRDISILLAAKRFAATMDARLQQYQDGQTVDRTTYRVVVVKPPELEAGVFKLRILSPDVTRVIGVIERGRPADLWQDNPSHKLAWA